LSALPQSRCSGPARPAHRHMHCECLEWESALVSRHSARNSSPPASTSRPVSLSTSQHQPTRVSVHICGACCAPSPPLWYKGVQCQPSLYDKIPGQAKKISDQCLVPLDTVEWDVRLISASCIVDYAVSRRFRTCNEGSQWDW